MSNELYHYGILGQKWGIRRFQNKDGSLTPAGQKRLEKKDASWAKKKSDKITAQAQKKNQRQLNKYADELLRDPNSVTSSGKLKASTINAYNQRMAELMTQSTAKLRSPSGRVVTFVAKRGEIGVMMALADEGYNMQQLKNGVWTDGRVAYKKTVLDKA